MGEADRRRFTLATMRFVASLRNGHTAFDDLWLWRTGGAPIGLDVIHGSDGWIVRRSAHSDLEPGSRLLSMDGVPIDDVVASKLPFVAGSSERERRHKLFGRSYLFPSHVRLTTDRGEAAIRRGQALPPRSPEPTLRWLERERVAFLGLPSFGKAEFEIRALHLLRDLPSAGALVVDIRGNGGGDTPERLIAALMPCPWRFWRAETPVHDGLRLAKGEPPGRRVIEAGWTAPEASAFAGPMAILTDRGTLSAAEDFALPFKDNGRAILVGEATGGSSGQPAQIDLGDGMRLWVGAKRQFLPDGGAFEGVGLAPDIAVEAGDAIGPDRILAAALQALA